MNNKKENLLADIRTLTVQMASYNLSEVPKEYLQLALDILIQIGGNGTPIYPVVEFMKKNFDAQKDNDGQTVIYLDDTPDHSDRCPSCGEPFEVEVEDGADCLECVAGREDPDEYNPPDDWIPWS